MQDFKFAKTKLPRALDIDKLFKNSFLIESMSFDLF